MLLVEHEPSDVQAYASTLTGAGYNLKIDVVAAPGDESICATSTRISMTLFSPTTTFPAGRGWMRYACYGKAVTTSFILVTGALGEDRRFLHATGSLIIF